VFVCLGIEGDARRPVRVCSTRGDSDPFCVRFGVLGLGFDLGDVILSARVASEHSVFGFVRFCAI
jgi:hypothetical protein